MALLVAWLWQGVVVAVAVHLALRWLPPTSAATRHHVWWVTLAVVLALPLDDLAVATSQPTQPLPPVPVVLPALPGVAMAVGVGAWLGVVVLALWRLGRSAGVVARLRRHAVPLPAYRASRLTHWVASQSTGRPASLCTSTEVAVPCALGLGPAVVLVPQRLAEELADAELDQLVMHEYAHLARRDDWWLLAQSLIKAVAGLHPAVWWIGRRIDFEREAACDDEVVALTGAVRPYTTCLARAARLALERGRCSASGTAFANSALAPGSLLRLRVVRLLDGRRNGAPHASARAVAFTAAALTVALAALGKASPVVEFVDSVLVAPSRPRAASIELAGPITPVARREVARVAHSPRPGVGGVTATPVLVAWAGSGAEPLPAAAGVDIEVAAQPAAEPPVPGQPLLPHLVRAPVLVPGPSPVPEASDGSAWRRLGEAGQAMGSAAAVVGSGATKSGSSVGRFFARTGRAIAASF